MDKQATKIELIQSILNIEDECHLETIKEVLENLTTSTIVEKIVKGRKPKTGAELNE